MKVITAAELFSFLYRNLWAKTYILDKSLIYSVHSVTSYCCLSIVLRGIISSFQTFQTTKQYQDKTSSSYPRYNSHNYITIYLLPEKHLIVTHFIVHVQKLKELRGWEDGKELRQAQMIINHMWTCLLRGNRKYRTNQLQMHVSL